MRALVRRLDALLRRVYGVFEFCDDPDCLFRLRVGRASHSIRCGTTVLQAGAPVLELHLWNEHLPPLPAAGPDLGWASQMQPMLIHLLRAVAGQMKQDPRLKGVQAVR